VHIEAVLDNDQLDALFLNVFILHLYMFRAASAHHQEVQIVLIVLTSRTPWEFWTFERVRRWFEIVKTFAALRGHSQKPLWFLLLLVVVVAIAANNSGRVCYTR
jgi:hypothetical protein